MASPKLFFGRRNLSEVVEAGSGTLDVTEPFNFYTKSNRVAPAGSGGEAIFALLYVTVTFTDSFDLFVTPYVDNNPLEEQVIHLIGNGTLRTKVYELGLSIPLVQLGLEVGRFAPRGTWFAVLFQTKFAAGSVPFSIEATELDWEPVEETKTITGALTP